MSEPAWVPLGGQGVDYKGDWAAGTAYAPGDVVRLSGVDYLAVNPSTGQTPPTAKYAGAELAYVERSTNLTVTTTPSDSWQTTPVVCDGGPVMVQFSATATFPAGVGASMAINLLQDGSLVVQLLTVMNVVAGQEISTVGGWVRITPTAGSHTFAIRAVTSTGSGVLAPPSFLRVSRA